MERAEINVTPLIDVALVLLIVFMVLVPLSRYGYDVAIPPESSDGPSSAPLILSVAADGAVRLNDRPLALDELPVRLAELLGDRAAADRVLWLDADDALNYELLLRIVDRARAGKELRLAVLDRPAQRGSGM
ncbi:MAG TPA: biopolymer transporter ExbD [Candidatus Polarisedimenticolaceae bacterium]|nr:biopolymer transporter ExbD [Candidatus Polarisedimenticolaceae bacterium]